MVVLNVVPVPPAVVGRVVDVVAELVPDVDYVE